MSQSTAVNALIDKGLAAQQTGDLSNARQNYLSALALSRDNPEALHLLGLVHEQENDRESAIRLIEQAIAVDPAEPIFRLNLAAILEKDRRFDLAADHIRAAVNARPRSSDLSTQLGAIELKRDDAKKAAAAYGHAIALDPQNVSALAGYGRAMLLMNNIEEAKRALHAVLGASPMDVDGLELGIRIAAAERDGKAIGQFAHRWKTLKSADQRSLSTLANLLFDLGYTSEACNIYEVVAELDPTSAETLFAYGRYCTAAQRYDKAGVAIDKALSIDPKSAAGLFALSRLKYFTGDLQSSEQLCEKVIAADPEFSPALTQLCTLRRGKMNDEHLTAMKALSADTSMPPQQLYELLLSLAKIYDCRGDIDDAFSALSRGNEIGDHNATATGGGFDRLGYTQETDQIISFFHRRAEAGRLDPGPYTPIFIVGTPRSGTTLTESILTAHPDIFSIGELSSLPEVYKRVLDWAHQSGATHIDDASAEQLQAWRDLYFSYFPRDNAENFMLDKQPINFRHAGLIGALFPDAKIVHIRRNPIETGFSIYRHPFNKQWPFSCWLENIAHFYGDYARIVEHWEKTLGSDFPLFQYENLIADFENEVRRMLSHCGLDWHDACLSFHRVQRPIATFSSVQARQPIRKTPERAALRYADYLTPLKNGLIAANIDLETGALNTGTAS